MKIELILDDQRVVTNYVTISLFAELVEKDLAARGIIRKALQQKVQNYFKPANDDKPNWFEHTHIRINNGGKQGGYVLLPVALVVPYADYLAGVVK